MEEKLNLVIHAEGHPELVIETNLNLHPTTEAIYAQVWACPDPLPFELQNKLLKTYYGTHALTDAVLYLSELLDEPWDELERNEVWL